MKKKLTFKGIWDVLKKAFSGFSDDKITKLSASLAYYTVFSLGPLMIVIIFLGSFFLGHEAVQGSVYGQIENVVGHNAALQVQDIIKNASLSGKSGLAATIGIITLLIGATSMFSEMQDSINTIWGFKAKPRQGIWLMVRQRLLSFGLIGSLGFLLLVSLAITAVVDALGSRLKAMFPDTAIVVLYIVNLLLTLGVITCLFAAIFRVLPDAKIKWKDVWPGALATAILFMLGRLGISLYISKSDIGSTYGTAGSLVILLLWVYYSSIILYFGAEFTKAYAVAYGSEIHPEDYAVATRTVEIEEGQKSLQRVEKKKDDEADGKVPTPTTSNVPSTTTVNVPSTPPPVYNSRSSAPLTHNNTKLVSKKEFKPLEVLQMLGVVLIYKIFHSSKSK